MSSSFNPNSEFFPYRMESPLKGEAEMNMSEFPPLKVESVFNYLKEIAKGA